MCGCVCITFSDSTFSCLTTISSTRNLAILFYNGLKSLNEAFFPFKIFSSSALFSSSHLSFPSPIQSLFFILLDLSQTQQFAYYHKIMSCGSVEILANVDLKYHQNLHLFPLIMLIFFSPFLISDPSCHDQMHCTDIPYS